jgi:hypothetical protein
MDALTLPPAPLHYTVPMLMSRAPQSAPRTERRAILPPRPKLAEKIIERERVSRDVSQAASIARKIIRGDEIYRQVVMLNVWLVQIRTA